MLVLSADMPAASVEFLPVLVLYVIVLGLLVAITVIDIKTMTIPDALNICILACGILAVFFVPHISILERLLGLICISVPLLLITMITPDSFGGGDVKLMAVAGFFLGWQQILIAACVGVLAGGIYATWLLASKRKAKGEHFAFGPSLCIGIAAAMLFVESFPMM